MSAPEAASTAPTPSGSSKLAASRLGSRPAQATVSVSVAPGGTGSESSAWPAKKGAAATGALAAVAAPRSGAVALKKVREDADSSSRAAPPG